MRNGAYRRKAGVDTACLISVAPTALRGQFGEWFLAKQQNGFWPNGRTIFGQTGERKKNFRILCVTIQTKKTWTRPIRKG